MSENLEVPESDPRGLGTENSAPPLHPDDDTYIVGPHESIPFMPDRKWAEVELIVTGLLLRCSSRNPSRYIHSTSRRYPDDWAQEVERAVDLKRRGGFLASAEIYERLTTESGIFYTGVMVSLYKTAAASGALLSGKLLLAWAESIFQRDQRDAFEVGGVVTNMHDHFARLAVATASAPDLETYLLDICGNDNYRFPRSYDAAVDEYHQDHNEPVVRLLKAIDAGYRKETNPRPPATPSSSRPQAAARTPQKSTSGCYIATAIYGSYDAPPVMTLRRFRDESLSRSFVGRTFIRFYYATSPSIAAKLQDATTINRVIKRVLDNIVDRLNRRS